MSRGHLARYCDGFEFRYENRKSSDNERGVGKRLTYKQPSSGSQS